MAKKKGIEFIGSRRISVKSRGSCSSWIEATLGMVPGDDGDETGRISDRLPNAE